MPDFSDTQARRGLRLFRRRAERDAQEPGRLRALAETATEKAREHSDQIGSLRSDIPALLRVVKAYARGEYRAIPWRSLVTLVAGLVYFVAPVDMIPDFIPVVGYIDDAAVIALAIRSVRRDLDAFEAWEAQDPTLSLAPGT
ncbi:MAG: YkvA family protein [Bacteroidota bacterium]